MDIICLKITPHRTSYMEITAPFYELSDQPSYTKRNSSVKGNAACNNK